MAGYRRGFWPHNRWLDAFVASTVATVLIVLLMGSTDEVTSSPNVTHGTVQGKVQAAIHFVYPPCCPWLHTFVVLAESLACGFITLIIISPNHLVKPRWWQWLLSFCFLAGLNAWVLFMAIAAYTNIGVHIERQIVTGLKLSLLFGSDASYIILMLSHFRLAGFGAKGDFQTALEKVQYSTVYSAINTGKLLVEVKDTRVVPEGADPWKPFRRRPLKISPTPKKKCCGRKTEEQKKMEQEHKEKSIKQKKAGRVNSLLGYLGETETFKYPVLLLVAVALALATLTWIFVYVYRAQTLFVQELQVVRHAILTVIHHLKKANKFEKEIIAKPAFLTYREQYDICNKFKRKPWDEPVALPSNPDAEKLCAELEAIQLKAAKEIDTYKNYVETRIKDMDALKDRVHEIHRALHNGARAGPVIGIIGVLYMVLYNVKAFKAWVLTAWTGLKVDGFNVTNFRQKLDLAHAAEFQAMFISTHLIGFLICSFFSGMIVSVLAWVQTWVYLKGFVPHLIVMVVAYIFNCVVLRNMLGNKWLAVDGQVAKNAKTMYAYQITFAVWHSITGLVGALGRAIYHLPLFIFNFCVMDRTSFHDSVAAFDTPCKSMQALIASHSRETNPLMNEAVRIFFSTAEESVDKGKKRSAASIRARNRWHLARSLLNNPQLRYFDKENAAVADDTAREQQPTKTKNPLNPPGAGAGASVMAAAAGPHGESKLQNNPACATNEASLALTVGDEVDDAHL